MNAFLVGGSPMRRNRGMHDDDRSKGGPASLLGLSPFQVRSSFQGEFQHAVRKLDGLLQPPVRASYPPAYGGDGASHLQQLQAQMQYDAMRKKKQKEVRTGVDMEHPALGAVALVPG